jgi:hypothetical protein
MANNIVAVAAELTRLAATDPDNILNQEMIVRVAKDNPILHEYFRWDDGEAAHRYRLLQAGQLIRRVRVNLVMRRQAARQIDVTLVRVDSAPRQVRVFQSPRGSRGNGGGYRMAADIVADDVLAGDMVDTLRVELGGLLKRFQEYLDTATAQGRDEPVLQSLVASVADILAESFPPPGFERDGEANGEHEIIG